MTQKLGYTIADLQFFGALGASISHEMKNVLATIKELMGLLDDLSRAATSDRPLDLTRLQSIAQRMQAQIERGDGIMRNLSRFAHSVDRPAATVELGDVAALVAQLAQHRAALRNVTIESPAGGPAIAITTDLFSLLHLIWTCLQHAVASSEAGGTIKLYAEKGPQAPCLRLIGLSAAGADPGAASAAVADRLKASLEPNAQAGELVIHLPPQNPATVGV